MHIERGPWPSHDDYLQAIAQKEITWTQQLGRPMQPDYPHNTLGRGKQ